jgi:hypothetical protein
MRFRREIDPNTTKKGLALSFNSMAPRRRCLFTVRLCDRPVPRAKASLGTELESNVIYFMSGVIAFALKQRVIMLVLFVATLASGMPFCSTNVCF